jgi:hypothetical protein
MTAGLPGAGIGGMFYLLMALLAPLWEGVRAYRQTRSPRQWQLVLRHFLLAASILFSMWLAAGALGIILAWPSDLGPYAGGQQDLAAYPRVISRNVALFTLSTLAVVLAAVEILRLSWRVLDRRGSHSLPAERRQPSATLPAARIARADDAA